MKVTDQVENGTFSQEAAWIFGLHVENTEFGVWTQINRRPKVIQSHSGPFKFLSQLEWETSV